MTITVQPARNEYTANAAQTTFNYTFKIFSITDLNVYITTSGELADDATDLTTAYTVTGVGDEDGGTIILTSGATLNDLVTIVSNIPSSRTTDYQNNGDFRPDVVNADFDRVVSLVKKVEDTASRAVLLEQSQQGSKPLSLPNPIASSFLRWKTDLSGLENATDLTSGTAQASNLMDFGAVGDGVADDSDAVQAWLDGRGRLFAPRGVYRLTRQMNASFFTDMFGEAAGVGSAGGSWPNGLIQEAEEGATIFAPDVGNFTGDHVFLFKNLHPVNQPLPSVVLRNFKIECPRAGGVEAILLGIHNVQDALLISNVNLIFSHKDHECLSLLGGDDVGGTNGPSVAQTGIIENVVCIGDDNGASGTTPIVHFERCQEMQFIGLKVFGGAQALNPKPTRVPISISNSRGLLLDGCSAAVTAAGIPGIEVYSTNRNSADILITGATTFEDVGIGWLIDGETRNEDTGLFTVSRINVKHCRYEFPTNVAGEVKRATFCELDIGTASVSLDANTISCMINGLFQSKLTNLGGTSNVFRGPVNEITSGSTTNQNEVIQKLVPSRKYISETGVNGYVTAANVSDVADNGFEINLLDGTKLSTQLPNGVHQLQTAGRGFQARVPADDKHMEIKVLDDGTLQTNDPANIGDFNINNDIPITSANVTFTFGSQVVGATIRRPSGSANTVRIPEDATAFPINGVVSVVQTGAGPLTIDGETGVTINGVLNGSTLVIGFAAGVRPAVVLTKLGANDWELVGSADPVT